MLALLDTSVLEMSYPYQPYHSSYSNHSTPPAFWDVEQQATTPVVDNTPGISPQSLQQQLSPVESPISLDPHQHQPPPQEPVFEAPRTIQIQERVPPSLFRFDNIDESHFVQQQPENTEPSVPRRRSSGRATSRVSDETHTDTTRPSSGGAIGPSRVPHQKTQSHPYRRPSTVGPTAGTSSRIASSVKSSTRAPEHEMLGERSSRLSRVATPAVGSSMAAPCPAMHMWRVTLPDASENLDQSATQRARVVSGASTASTSAPGDGAMPSHEVDQPMSPPTAPSVGTLRPPPVSARPQSARRLLIRADVYFDPDASEMTAVLELPGIKKHDLTIRMDVCPYTKVRQLTILGRSRPVLPESVYTVQERKFGDFYRTVVVPSNTKPEDIVATMEDGVLTLKMPCPPGEREEPQDIIIQ